MKKTGILNGELIQLIATMGHTDRLAIADSGLPIPPDVYRIDLALVAGIPTFLQTLQAVLAELQVERVVIAAEMPRRNPTLYDATRQLLGAVPLDQVAHERFKELVFEVRAVVRTGEQTPYANIILQSGVAF